MFALFTSIPLVGHFNPLIRQASELQRRGWRVAIASTREMSAHAAAEAPAVPFIDLGPLGDMAARLRRDQEAASLDRSFARGTFQIVRGLAAVWPTMFGGLKGAIASDRPDVMVIDLFTSAGLSLAESSGIPFVVNNPDLLASLPVTLLPPADHLPLLFSGRSRHDVGSMQRMVAPLLRRVATVAAALTIERDLNRLRTGGGLAPITIDRLLRGRTILVDGAFGIEYERALPPDVHMIGPMLPASTPPLPADLDAWLSEGPSVYCNLGTLAVAAPGQVEKMAEAFRRIGHRVLWVLRPRSAWPQESATLRVIEWGPPPLSLLSHPNVRAFVSHCGINLAYESIVAGTPIVGIPMFADQRDMAVRVADAGAGVWLDKYAFTADSLAAAIARVTTEASFTRVMPALQEAIKRTGGVSRAADLIAGAAASSHA